MQATPARAVMYGMAVERRRHHQGAIDDARIYSRALSAEEVAVLAGGNSAYDGLNRRIVHAERDFYYNTSWQTLEVRTNGVANPLKQYPPSPGGSGETGIWDLRYIDAPVLRWRDEDTDDTVDDTLYYLNDANMNPPSPVGSGETGVTAVVDGSDGDVVERYAYDPYGKVTVLNGEDDADGGVSDWSADADNISDWDNRILYCGYRLDPETGANGQGIYHVRFRPYHCTIGRWTVWDFARYIAGLNLYEYVSCAPITKVDWTGLQDREGSAPVPPPTTWVEERIPDDEYREMVNEWKEGRGVLTGPTRADRRAKKGDGASEAKVLQWEINLGTLNRRLDNAERLLNAVEEPGMGPMRDVPKEVRDHRETVMELNEEIRKHLSDKPMMCCGGKLYDHKTQGCCGDVIYNKVDHGCCGNELAPKDAQYADRCCYRRKYWSWKMPYWQSAGFAGVEDCRRALAWKPPPELEVPPGTPHVPTMVTLGELSIRAIANIAALERCTRRVCDPVHKPARTRMVERAAE